MITKQSNGNAISQNFIDAVESDSRTFLGKLLINGTDIDCSISKITFQKGICSKPDEFTVGSVISYQMIAEVKELSQTVKGEYIEVRIGVDIGNDTYEWVTLGTVKCTETAQDEYTTTITAYGRTVAESSGAFTPPQTPTLANIAAEIGTECGCTVTLDNSIDSTIQVTKDLNGMTTYQALQMLANVVGGYAIDTNEGNIKIGIFDDTVTYSVDTGRMLKLPKFDENDYVVVGIKAKVSEDTEYTVGNAYSLVYDSPYMNDLLFADMAQNLYGYTYRPGTVGLSMGDPRLEGDDVLLVTDISENTYVVPCHFITHIYAGGLSTEIQSAKSTYEAEEIGTSGPLTQWLGDISGELNNIKQTAEEASIKFSILTDYSNSQTVTLKAVVYKNGEDITNTIPGDFFNWYSKAETGITNLGTGNTLTYSRDDAGYGTTIVCSVIINEELVIATPDDYALITPDGYVLLGMFYI